MATKKTSQEVARELLREREIASIKASEQNRVNQLRKGLNNMASEAERDKQRINSLLSDYETEYSKSIDSYNNRFVNNNKYRGDASGALRFATESNNKLTNIESEAKKLLDKWGDKLGKNYVSSVNDFFTSASKTSKDILDTYTTDFNYMRTFKDEKEYNSVIEEQKNRQEENEKRIAELKAYSLPDAEDELKTMQRYLSKVEDGSFGKKDLQMQGYANEQALKNAIQEKTDEINNYKLDSKKYGINDNKSPLELSFPNRTDKIGLEDLEGVTAPYSLSSLDKAIYSAPTDWASGTKNKEKLNRLATEMEQNKGVGEKAFEGKATNASYYEDHPLEKFTTFATDSEKKLYTELMNEEGVSIANAYISSIDSELNERMNESLWNARYKYNTTEKVSQAMSSGLTGSVENIALYVDSAIKDLQGKPLEIDLDLDQLQFSYNAQNSSVLDKFALEALNTTAAQLPAILSGMFVPVVGGALGSASFFGSAAGGALREAKQKGYTDEQAMAYANLVGASELLVERFLGAVPGVGKMSGKISNFTLGLDNALLRVVSQMGLSALSEFTEESLQSIIEPALAALVEGSSYDAPTWEEVLYSGLLGAVTGMGFGGVTAVSNNAIQTDLGNKIISTEGAYTDLVGLGKTMPEGSAALKMATDLSSIEGKPNANKVGRLYQAVGDSLTKGDVTSESKYKEITNRVKTASQKALDNALDTKELTNESKEQAKTMYKPLSGVDPNSEEAIAHAENFVEDFETAVMAGRVAQETGETIPDLINEGHVTTLTEEQTKAAIDSGRIEALESQQKKTISTEQKSANYNKMISRSIEQINADSKADTTLTTVQKTAVRIAEKLNTALGFYNSADLFNEQRDGIKVKNIEGKKVLFLDRNTTDPVRQVFVHELAHFSENTKNYTKVAKAIMKSKALDQWLTQKGFEGKSLLEKMSAYRLDKKTQYQEYGENLKFEEANAEMIANFLGETFGTEEAFDNFMSELNTQDKRTVIDYLKDVVAWLKSTFKGDIPSELKNIERMYQKALKESAKDNKTVSVHEEVKKTSKEAQYSIPEVDNNDVKRYNERGWARNLFSKEDYSLLNQKYSEAFNKNYPSKLKDGTKVIEVNNKIVFVSGTFESPVIECVVAFNSENASDDVINKVIVIGETQYGKYSKQDIKTWAKIRTDLFGEELFVAYNREDYTSRSIKNFEKRKRATLPESFKSYGYSGRFTIRDGVYVKDEGEISGGTEGSESVTSYAPSAETEKAYMDAAERGDTETTQKMVDDAAKQSGAILAEDGNPLKLYRGTKGGQNVFAKSNTHGGKIYTTDSIVVASGYGDGSGRTTELRNQVKGESSVYALYGFADKILTIDADHGVWHKLKIPDELIKYSDGKITATNAELADWAEQEGYNALRIDNVKDGSRESANEIIFFDENLVKSADAITQDDNGNIIPLSERFNTEKNDIRFSIPNRAKKLQQDFADGKITHAELVQEEAKLMDEARENYGTIEEGENAVNKTTIPSAVEDSKRINRFVRTITETGSVDARTANALGEKLLLGELSHKVASDEDAISTAEKAINNGTAKEIWNRTVTNINKMPSKNDLAIGERLLAEALNSSDSVKALTIASDLADAFTRAGQWVQAASLLKKMTGPGMLIHLQRTVNKLNADMTKRYGNKYPLLQMPENLATELVQATTQEDVEVIAEEIMQDLADHSPVTFLDKWNAWRYLAMLGNPLTHFRNIIGNAVFMPATMMRYESAALLEQALPIEERTKSVKVDEKYMDFAKQDSKSKEAKKMLNMSDKMTGESGIARKRKIFKPKWLNSLYELNSELLGREDAMFKTAYYKRALAGYLQAKNIDLETITEEQLKVARNYASEEAAKNTYNDISTIALKLKSLEKMHPALNVFVNGLVPFKQTPINIVKRGVEYSPFGLLNSLVLGTRKLKKGDISASEFIDGLSAGGSGTATFLIGMLFATIGAASGGLGDDDEDKFRKLAGEQEYALRIGGKTYTLDWAAPMCIPFFMGVEFVTSMRKSDPGFTLQALEDTFWNSLDPLVNMSMLSGVESALSSLQGAKESEKIGAGLNAAALSYLGQLTPTIFGKFATVVDKYRRTNYVDKNIPVPAMLQKLYNSTIAKVPILSMKRTKYIDAWGREVSQGNVVERVAESFFSPGYMSTMDYTDVDLEILELYENTGENGVFPDNAPKYFTVNKERVDLTAKEYETFAKAKGHYSFEYVRDFLESDYNDQMSDAERVKVLKKLYEYATDKAKAEVSDYNVEENNKLAYKTDKEGKSVVEYYANNVLSERYEPKLYNDALESASIKDAEKLKTDIIAWKVKNGSTEKEAKSSLRSSVTTYWKPKYLEAYASGNEAEMEKIREKLSQSDLYGSDRQLNSTLNDWEEKYEEEK